MNDSDKADKETVTIYRGDNEWHDGDGWYWVHDEYPEEGSCGAFATEQLARENATKNGYVANAKVILNYKPKRQHVTQPAHV